MGRDRLAGAGLVPAENLTDRLLPFEDMATHEKQSVRPGIVSKEEDDGDYGIHRSARFSISDDNDDTSSCLVGYAASFKNREKAPFAAGVVGASCVVVGGAGMIGSLMVDRQDVS